MRPTWTQEPRLIWSFWAAAGLSAVGGAIPFLIGGQSSRISSVFIPFAVAALAFVACALAHDQGRLPATLLYLFAGLAIVYGVLTMFAVPLMLAVLGTCPLPPAPCAAGLPHPLTLAENTGIGFATGFGVGALFVGFFGLAVVYRRTAIPAPKPPVRSIPPIDSTRPTTVAAAPTPIAENGAKPAATPEEPELELPAHQEEERPELPPHESNPPTT